MTEDLLPRAEQLPNDEEGGRLYAAKLSPQEQVTTALGFVTLKPPC